MVLQEQHSIRDIKGRNLWESKLKRQEVILVENGLKKNSYVYNKDIILNNEAKNSPLFLLCFMMTNESPKAISLANRIIDGIKRKVEK